MTFFERASGRLGRGVALWGGAIVAAVALSFWPALQQTYWWYPETEAYWFWIMAVVVLAALSFRRPPKLGLDIAWGALVAICFSGLISLTRDLLRITSGADLTRGALLGARRRLAGEAVYDLRGFDESVNAAPFFIVSLVPLALLTDQQAVAVFVGVSVLSLLVFVIWGPRYLGGHLGLPSRFWHHALFLIALTTYGAFQRSWRLGQVDTLLVAILAMVPISVTSPRSWRWYLSPVAAGLAVALKIAPALAFVPALVRAFFHTERALYRRWLAVAFAVVLGTTAFAGVVLGPAELSRFARNVTLLSQGTTSGNNYSLAARISTYGRRKLRSTHHPLPAKGRRLSGIVAAFSLAGLFFLLARLRRAKMGLLMAISLASLPLVTPTCWDIYLLWGGALPAIIAWLSLLARRRALGPQPEDTLRAIALLGGYLLAGTMGNTVHRDYASGVVVQLKLPVWLDELPTVGHLLLLAALVSVALRDQRHPLAEDSTAA